MLKRPNPRETKTFPIAMITVVRIVALRRPIFRLSSKVRIEISKKLNREEITAKRMARKKHTPMILPPGSFSKISVITLNTRLGPADSISTPPEKAEGTTTNPARIAAAVSKVETMIASLFRLFSFGMLAPRVTYSPQPMPTEKRTCVAAWAKVVKLNLLKSGRR